MELPAALAIKYVNASKNCKQQASASLQVSYIEPAGIRTIQELLGHSVVKTMMVCSARIGLCCHDHAWTQGAQPSQPLPVAQLI